MVVPAVHPHASSAGVLTMQRLHGPLISSCAATAAGAASAKGLLGGSGIRGGKERGGGKEGRGGGGGGGGWKRALSKAISVTALSVVDEGSCFHADLHMGNLVYLPATDQIGLLDFGVCGVLPPWLRGALLLQARPLPPG